jgi:hypothetical protein
VEVARKGTARVEIIRVVESENILSVEDYDAKCSLHAKQASRRSGGSKLPHFQMVVGRGLPRLVRAC